MITVLTPTFNRAYTLDRLYVSLCAQVNQDFEWVIVDDGSSDATKVLVMEFISQKKISINYVFQKNSGKHVAINNGLNSSRGSWIFIVDSDDALTSDALSEVSKSTRLLAGEDVVGVCFRRAYFDGSIIGESSNFGSDTLCLSPSVAGKTLKGDLAYVFKKNLMLKNLFPVIPGEKFVPELYIWNKIGDAGKIYFFVNKFIYLCEYLPDGYSKNFSTSLRRNPKGFYLFYAAQFSREKFGIVKIKMLIRAVQCRLFVLFKKFKLR